MSAIYSPPDGMFPLHWPLATNCVPVVARQIGQILADLDTTATRWSKGIKRKCKQPAGGIICLNARLVKCSFVMSRSCAESSKSFVVGSRDDHDVSVFMASQ